ncbi:bifunctional 3'-5' exonuclease/DNA polymerase [Virgisporangium aliadipatigenens]|uniref:bifunctional 3'-5' exonuclease/DNA polymerase n=1 Tax=Virgisporangium aliadipatigenens TaxID=741659 RepID=UPI001941E467|nr:bifunctional 3'-5' exonuclease/DNA polymerase [Virgisporangium aliadipatigenens]
MLRALLPDPDGGCWLRDLDASGLPVGPAYRAEAPPVDDGVRWVWASTAHAYAAQLQRGVRVERCHDLELTEALLLGYSGRWGEPRGLGAITARRTGAPVPPDPPARAAVPPGEIQGTLFDASPAGPPGSVDDVVEAYADQRRRIAAVDEPGRFRFLVAAESAGALVAAEMGHVGLPWRVDVHDAVLREMLGEPSPVGGPPRRLVELTAAIQEAFGGQRVHPESPAEVVRAFARVGVPVPNTRSWVLQQVEHPAVPLLLEFKELYRIWVAHGWSWLEQWVRDGRFRAEYVPGGVVSGRWATRGGGALQIPRVVRKAVVADPGWTFVVADAGQLEPRVLAAMSGDRGLTSAARAGDLYAALAADSFGGDRAKAKVALLGAMYGQTGGQAAPALAVLRHSYPVAWEYVEAAARTGEAGGLVRSWLGRTCPPPSVSWGDQLGGEALEGAPASDEDPRSSSRARARGRFTRNFVIQATAAEWALALLARLRTLLAGSAAELVFFQHDEVIVHCPEKDAPEVAEAVARAGDDARRLLFGDTPVRFPLGATTVRSYSDAK